MNEKKGSKKTDEKESTAKTILEYVISIGIAIVAALLINNFILLNYKGTIWLNGKHNHDW